MQAARMGGRYRAERLIECLRRARSEALQPPPILSLSQWAERFAYLSPETSAEPGKFHAFAYQNAIMDAVTDPSVRRIVVMKSARVGYTKILDNIVGYFLHQDPSPILVVQPRVEDAEDYSRTEIAPMLRDTPVLSAIVGDLKAKDSNQRILKRVLRNGASVSFVGANSAGGFRRITARIVAFDEVDGYPVQGAGDEGDQVALGTKRSESFWNRKIILGSTPTVKGFSRIERAWSESDQRLYYVPCPHCGHRQVLRWANLSWDKVTSDGEVVAQIPVGATGYKHLADTAHFVCESEGCRKRIDEHHKPAMINAGEWIAQRPFAGHAGFHIWAAYSLFPNAAWAHLVEEWLRVHKDPSLRKTFVNLVLGEPWEEGEAFKDDGLIARAEVYGDDSLPVQVKVITGFADIQGDRIEVQLIGWGADEEAWPFLYEIINQDPAQPQAWQELDALLLRRFSTQAGRVLRIAAFGIDTGGNHEAQVYSFCKQRRGRRIFPTKGVSGNRPMWPLRETRSKSNEKLWLIGVDSAKDAIYSRLKIKPLADAVRQPGLIHFPAEDGFGPEYFEQLTSETKLVRYKMGRPYTVWWLPKGKRNEVLDTFVGALAVRRSLPRRIEAGVEYAVSASPKSDDAPAPVHMPPAVLPRTVSHPALPDPRRGGWLGAQRGFLR